MPRDGAIIVRDIVGKLDVECDKCGRRGRYHPPLADRTAELIDASETRKAAILYSPVMMLWTAPPTAVAYYRIGCSC